MGIYKSGHVYPAHNWFLHLIARIFKVGCTSHITDPYAVVTRHCIYLHRHPGPHSDGLIKWGYGDDMFQD